MAAYTFKKRHSSTQCGMWLGYGMMVLVVSSVVIPTLVGAALGLWLDEHLSARRVWTLPLLMAGLAIGCSIAGRRIAKKLEEQKDNDN